MVDLSRFGTKHECVCGAKYYDLNKPKPVCPKCGEPPSSKKKKPILKTKIEPVEDIDDFESPEDVEVMDDDAFEGLDTDEEFVEEDEAEPE